MKRVLIIGNSGSGKTWLSKKLSEGLNYKIIHFDEHFWEPGGFNKKRERSIVLKEIEKLSQEESWIMEGVFGDLAEVALANATSLIFLDKQWTECEQALLNRGSKSSFQLDKETAEKNFNELLVWAKAYYKRESKTSLLWHKQLFDSFLGDKAILKNRQEMTELLNNITNKQN